MKLTVRFRPPAMVGTPPSARQIPAHPELHALDFAQRYAEPLNYHAEQVMIDLGIPTDQIGASAPLHGIQHATFHWRERTGGGVSPAGRLNLDSGIFNMELLTRDYGDEVAKIWRKMRLKPRIEAITAHELAEAESGSHVEALTGEPIPACQLVMQRGSCLSRWKKDGNGVDPLFSHPVGRFSPEWSMERNHQSGQRQLAVGFAVLIVHQNLCAGHIPF